MILKKIKENQDESDDDQWEEQPNDTDEEEEDSQEEDWIDKEQDALILKLQIQSEELVKKQMNDSESLRVQDEIDYLLEDRQEQIQRECLNTKKFLDMGSRDIEDFDALTIGIYLQELHCNLQGLNLCSNRLSDEGALSLYTGLQFHSNLMELYLGNNPFYLGTALEGLATILPLFKSLRILGLGGLHMSDQNLVRICFGLSGLDSLKNLQIHRNDISDEGVLALVSLFVADEMRIETLYLGQNENITEDGIIKLCECLTISEGGKRLKCLHLNDIGLSEKAIQAIGITLSQNSTLEELNLGDCGVEDEGFTILSGGLKENTTLLHLHLWSNFLTFESAQLIVEILENYNSTVQSLSLANNDIVDREILATIEGLLQQNGYFKNTLKDERYVEKTIEEMKRKKEEELREIKLKEQEQMKKPEEILSVGKIVIAKAPVPVVGSGGKIVKSQVGTGVQGNLGESQKIGVQKTNVDLKQASQVKPTQLAVSSGRQNTLNSSRPLSGIDKSSGLQSKIQTTNKIINTRSSQVIPKPESNKASASSSLKNDQQGITGKIDKKSTKVIGESTKKELKPQVNLLKNSKANQDIKKTQINKVNQNVNMKNNNNNNDIDEDDEDDLVYIPLSVSLGGQVVKRDIDVVAVVKDQNNTKEESKVEDFSEEELEEDESKVEIDNEWLDVEDDDEDIKELAKLDRLEGEEGRQYKLEYADEFYNEEESNARVKQSQQISSDALDTKTLVWKGFFLDNRTGLLKSKMQ